MELQLEEYGHLITKRKVEEEDDFATLVNTDSRRISSALGDPNLRALQKGTILQLERKGYFICDRPYARCVASAIPACRGWL